MKSIVHATPVDSNTDLISRLVYAAADIQHIPGAFKQIIQSMVQQYHACIDNNGGHFDILLGHFHISSKTAHVICLTNKLILKISDLCLFISCTYHTCPMTFSTMDFYANLNPCEGLILSLNLVPISLGHPA